MSRTVATTWLGDLRHLLRAYYFKLQHAKLFDTHSACSNLNPIITRCKSLEKKSRFIRFFNSKEHKEEIQGIRESIISLIHNFTVWIASFSSTAFSNLLCAVLQQHFH